MIAPRIMYTYEEMLKEFPSMSHISKNVPEITLAFKPYEDARIASYKSDMTECTVFAVTYKKVLIDSENGRTVHYLLKEFADRIKSNKIIGLEE